MDSDALSVLVFSVGDKVHSIQPLNDSIHYC